mmetsp:Transcript_29072/g.98053  ORF Transcript_29072/g.98053 Transcript_29072/m.98053 type:complete len:171 (+) Transcript_29072:867-1379(+)
MANSNSGDHHWTYTDEEEEEANVGIAPHTDFEAFTLMHQDAPGLQLLRRDQLARGPEAEWYDAPVGPEFVVIIGDVLERYTNGLLKATPHRVLPMEHPRQSIIRFHAVAPDALVQPLPQFITPENPAAYTPVTMEHHMNTTLGNLDAGVASWDSGNNASKSATYHYNTPS